MSVNRNVNLTIFITSMSDSKSLSLIASSTSGLKSAFNAFEMNGKFGRIQCQKSKESSSRGKRQVFLCRRTVRVKVNCKVIPTSTLKIEGRQLYVGGRPEKEGQLAESIGNQSPSFEVPERSKRGIESKEQRRFQERSDC